MTDRPDIHEERLRRWRLVLGGAKCDGIGCKLSAEDGAMDRVLGQLYGGGDEGTLGSDPNQRRGPRRGGTEASSPNVSRWLGDVRKYFPDSVVQVMQEDAIERIGLHNLLTEPDILELVEPDVNLVATLISLKHLIPGETRATARVLVQQVVDKLMRKLRAPMQQAIAGSLNRAIRNHRPRHNEIDWGRTIRANLKNYQPDYKTIIPERLIGYGRKKSALREVIICIDQSGSMATSVVYASIFGAVMASIPTLKTHMVVFDTAVVDLTADLGDPVDLLFGAQLGGGTDINQALGYCQQLVSRPQETILVLISDLYEGGNRDQMLTRAAQLVRSGVQMVTLLALDDSGAPGYDRQIAAEYAALGIPAFACTPDLFPDLMAAAINQQDMTVWAAQHDIKLPRPLEA